jgi:hypothetical protein
MTAGPPVDGPALSRWWDSVAPLRPRAMWIGSLDLVHFDAPVRVLHPEPLDPLHRLLLRALEATGPANLARIDARLALGPAPLRRWLAELHTAGLLKANDHYALTPAGIAALESGIASWPIAERRRFTFVINPDRSPHFVPWLGGPGALVPALTATADMRWLADCIQRPATWKRRVGFPEAVAASDDGTHAPGQAAWRGLTVARGEQPLVALVLTADAPTHLIGFTPKRGDLDVTTPVLRLDTGWEEAFPDLAADPGTVRTDIGAGWQLIGEGRLQLVLRQSLSASEV